MSVVYGVCTNSLDRIRNYVLPHVKDRSLLMAWNQTSIAAAYNVFLEAVCQRDVDLLVLLHDDLELTDPLGEEKLLEAASQEDVALVGVAGGRGVTSLAWWNHETVGHQQIADRILDFGPRTGDVDLLEGSLLAFTPWAIENLRFDETLPGFHGYDEIALQARYARKRAVVADVDTFHHTHVGFTSAESAQTWFSAAAYVKEKWDL